MPPGFFSSLGRPIYPIDEEEALRTPGFNPAGQEPLSAGRRKRPAPLPMVTSAPASAPVSSVAMEAMPPTGVIEQETPYMNRSLPGGVPRNLPAPLPRVAPSAPAVQPAMGIPGGGASPGPISSMRPQSPGAQLQEAQDVWESGYKKPQGFFGRLGNALSAAGRGAVEGLKSGEGIVPGALRQGVIAGVDPKAERRLQFEQRIQPQILQRLGREQMDRDYQAGQAAQAAAAQKAAIEAQKGPLEVKKLESDIALQDAQAKAAATGKPEYRDLADPDGTVSTYQVFPNGTRVKIGPSGAGVEKEAERRSREAENEKNRKNARTIAGMHESSADRRQGRSEAAQDRRATSRALRPKETLDVETDFNKLKSATDAASQKLFVAKQTAAGDMNDEEVQKAQIEYNKAFQAENDYAASAARNYPEDFEGGAGTGGRAYVKRREGARPARLPRASSSSGGSSPSQATRRTITVKQVNQYIQTRADAGEKIDWEEARRRFSNQGIDIE